MATENPDPEPQTSELLAQIQAGQTEAVEALFRRYYDRVLRIVRRQLGPALREKIESGDVVQETFATAQKKLNGFEFAADTVGPGEACGKTEQVDGLWRTLMLLSEEQREIIMLRNFGEYSWQTIAAVMQLSTANAARARHARAMANLSAHMLRREGEPND